MGDEFYALRLILQTKRRQGVPFRAAWVLAVDALLAETKGPAQRDVLRVALAATRESWRRAWTGDVPTANDRAAATLAAGLRDDPVDPARMGILRRAELTYPEIADLLGLRDDRAAHKLVAPSGRTPPDLRRHASHCANGHRYTPRTTGVDSLGQRFCKLCKARWSQEKRDRQKAAA